MKEYQITFELNTGISTIENPPRNLQVLESMSGCFVENTGVRTHESDTVDVTEIDCAFPYPQKFELKELTIVCYSDSIYEVINGVEELKLGNLPVGLPWSVADFYQYLVLNNGKIAIQRDPITKVYSIVSHLGGNSCLNLNGQLLIISPNQFNTHINLYSRLHEIIHIELPGIKIW